MEHADIQFIGTGTPEQHNSVKDRMIRGIHRVWEANVPSAWEDRYRKYGEFVINHMPDSQKPRLESLIRKNIDIIAPKFGYGVIGVEILTAGALLWKGGKKVWKNQTIRKALELGASAVVAKEVVEGAVEKEKQEGQNFQKMVDSISEPESETSQALRSKHSEIDEAICRAELKKDKNKKEDTYLFAIDKIDELFMMFCDHPQNNKFEPYDLLVNSKFGEYIVKAIQIYERHLPHDPIEAVPRQIEIMGRYFSEFIQTNKIKLAFDFDNEDEKKGQDLHNVVRQYRMLQSELPYFNNMGTILSAQRTPMMERLRNIYFNGGNNIYHKYISSGEIIRDFNIFPIVEIMEKKALVEKYLNERL